MLAKARSGTPLPQCVLVSLRLPQTGMTQVGDRLEGLCSTFAAGAAATYLVGRTLAPPSSKPPAHVRVAGGKRMSRHLQQGRDLHLRKQASSRRLRDSTVPDTTANSQVVLLGRSAIKRDVRPSPGLTANDHNSASFRDCSAFLCRVAALSGPKAFGVCLRAARTGLDQGRPRSQR
jgi:hypothetical protein